MTTGIPKGPLAERCGMIGPSKRKSLSDLFQTSPGALRLPKTDDMVRPKARWELSSPFTSESLD
eukprot:4160047-Amphidinium_carterae.1